MAYVNFVKSKTLAQAKAESVNNPGKIYFPTDSHYIVMGGKEYGKEVYVGTEQPTGDEYPVWVNPNDEGSSGVDPDTIRSYTVTKDGDAIAAYNGEKAASKGTVVAGSTLSADATLGNATMQLAAMDQSTGDYGMVVLGADKGTSGFQIINSASNGDAAQVQISAAPNNTGGFAAFVSVIGGTQKTIGITKTGFEISESDNDTKYSNGEIELGKTRNKISTTSPFTDVTLEGIHIKSPVITLGNGNKSAFNISNETINSTYDIYIAGSKALKANNVVQSTGTSQTNVMSQKAVTDAIKTASSSVSTNTFVYHANAQYDEDTGEEVGYEYVEDDNDYSNNESRYSSIKVGDSVVMYTENGEIFDSLSVVYVADDGMGITTILATHPQIDKTTVLEVVVGMGAPTELDYYTIPVLTVPNNNITDAQRSYLHRNFAYPVDNRTSSSVVVYPVYGKTIFINNATSIRISTPAAPTDESQKTETCTIRWNCPSTPTFQYGDNLVWANGEIPTWGPMGEISIAYGGSKHFCVGTTFKAV